MSFRHLSADDRSTIATLLGEGYDDAAIAQRLGVNRSTIGREVRRNGLHPKPVQRPLPPRPAILALDGRTKRGSGLAQDKHGAAVAYARAVSDIRRQNRYYVAREAGKQATARRAAANRQRTRLVHGSGSWLERYVRRRLTKRQWSPEQIAGRLRRNHSITLYPQTIYDYLYASPEKDELVKHLRRGGNRYRRRHGTAAHARTRQARLPSIHDRPAVVEERSRLGDWEGDTVVGLDRRDRILTHVDRASGECRLGLVLDYNARAVADHTMRALTAGPAPVRTITYDRGSEFAGWERVQARTGARVYFANAYHSWERGSNENLNGLLRQYCPKRSDFKAISPRRLKAVEQKLNNRPRKRYNYRTPIEQRGYLARVAYLGGVAFRVRI